MAVVKYTPIPWQMDDFNSIKAHIEQFHTKMKEVGLKHIIQETDVVDWTKLIQPTIQSKSNNYNEFIPICSFVYQMPKGTGEVNFSEPDTHGAVEIVSYSPNLTTNLYIRVEWGYSRSVYSTPNTNNRGMVLCTNIDISRNLDFQSSAGNPNFRGTKSYYSTWGSSTGINGTIRVIQDSVITLTREGLTILHGMYENSTGRINTFGSPRNVCQFSITVNDDQSVTVYHPPVYDTGSTNRDGTLSGAYKCSYNMVVYKTSGFTTYYTRSPLTSFPFNDLSVDVNGQLQGLNTYTMNDQNDACVNDNIYSHMRSGKDGDQVFYCFYRGVLTKRIVYIQETNSMTPNANTTSTTITDYNREYSHTIEYAQSINTSF